MKNRICCIDKITKAFELDGRVNGVEKKVDVYECCAVKCTSFGGKYFGVGNLKKCEVDKKMQEIKDGRTNEQ